MCLDIKQKQKPLIAKKDIVVFKNVFFENDELVTSYQESVVEIGKTYHSELQVIFDRVEAGLHSFKLKKDAAEKAKYYREIVVKCIIPQGSTYYPGFFGNFKCYASDTLYYDKIIKDYDKR